MASTSSKSTPGQWLTGFVIIVVLGVALGFALSGQALETQATLNILPFAIGFAWAFLILQWVDIVGQAFGFFADPLPDDIPLDDRDAVRQHAETIKPSSDFARRAAQLLDSWCTGHDTRATLDLAAFQSSRARRPVLAGALFVVLLLGPAYLMGATGVFVTGGLFVLALTLLAKLSLLSRIDLYLESRLLARLPASLPGTDVTAAELGQHIGKAIDGAFNQYIPKPDALASVIREAVEEGGKKISDQGEALNKSLAGVESAIGKAGAESAEKLDAVQSDIAGKWTQAASEAADTLKSAQTELASTLSDSAKEVAGELKETQGALANSLSETSKDVVNELREVQASLSGSLSGAGKEAAEQLNATLSEYADKLETTNKALVGQLVKITEVEQSIEKVLHAQQATEGTLRSITTTEEFKETLQQLRRHLEESDKALQELAKPRSITLVEEEGEISQG